MYKHYYMKQYNCVFCAFPLLSVCLTSFAQILTTNENWILFLAFLKIMWTIFGCKWHFPSRDTTYDIEHDKKECQERRNWSRRIKVSQEDGQNWSCGSISVFVCIFWTNDLICIIVKTWENISSLSLSSWLPSVSHRQSPSLKLKSMPWLKRNSIRGQTEGSVKLNKFAKLPKSIWRPTKG